MTYTTTTEGFYVWVWTCSIVTSPLVSSPQA